jgi:hypothetical protein
VRTWVKLTLGGVALIVLIWVVIAGTSAYFVFRHFDRRTAAESETLPEFDKIRARFPNRPPLIEIVDARAGDIRINRLDSPDGRSVETFHVLAWKVVDRELIRTDVPVWLLRFNTVNILSRLGIGPARLRLTVQDVERYGPGIVVDYAPPGSDRVLLWVD